MVRIELFLLFFHSDIVAISSFPRQDTTSCVADQEDRCSQVLYVVFTLLTSHEYDESIVLDAPVKPKWLLVCTDNFMFSCVMVCHLSLLQ